MIPGEWLLTDEPLELNAGRPTQQITVRNTGELTVQVGSHYHFFEVNRALSFDRRRALGMRLNIPAGQAIRFDPGEQQEVELVKLSGTGRILGFNGLVNGSLGDELITARILRRARESGFCGDDDDGTDDASSKPTTPARSRKGKGSR